MSWHATSHSRALVPSLKHSTWTIQIAITLGWSPTKKSIMAWWRMIPLPSSTHSMEYKTLQEQTGLNAIPSMAVLTIKTDGQGDPVCAKSRIVILGNQETTPWSNTDCFTPIVSAPVIWLMAALAVCNKTVLKQGDCKNAFCHTALPENEVTIIRPPANCPISKPNTYWKLNKTLYSLRCSPQYWFNTLLKYFREIGLCPTSHASYLFVSTPVLLVRSYSLYEG
jgi:Reverse transcriptase (RNA-dependent DNA polymerase)